MRPFFSIIVPNLNEQKYLPVFLKSLYNQSFKDFEVRIVDGFSSDGSIEIILRWIKKFGDNTPLFVRFDETRNIGYIRNLGCDKARGKVLFHTSSDVYFEPFLLEKLFFLYENDPDLLSVSGRTFPFGTSVISHLSYQAFDLLRFLFTISPFPVKKYRPSGNFMTIRSKVFRRIGGYPEVRINEDGLLGQKLDEFIKLNNLSHKSIFFNLKLYVGHHVKRFEQVGGIKTFLFYIYVLSNLFPFLKPLLKHIELKSAKTFVSRSDLK